MGGGGRGEGDGGRGMGGGGPGSNGGRSLWDTAEERAGDRIPKRVGDGRNRK